MIGNDIVDLALAKKESNWQRRGFLDKLFTRNEQQLILSYHNPELMVWNLWSRKEAAYKIYNRQSGQRVFNPIQFECNDDKVVFGNTVYYTKTEVTTNYVYSIAVTSKDDFNILLHQTNRKGIQKINHIPNWFDTEMQQLFPTSITHHGRFLRVVILK